MNQETAMNVMKSKMLFTAIAMSLAATAGSAIAQDTSSTKMAETMSHDAMMNQEDAVKHDTIVKHDMAMKKAAAKNEVAMKADAMKGGSKRVRGMIFVVLGLLFIKMGYELLF